jgi:hypothetical protein
MAQSGILVKFRRFSRFEEIATSENGDLCERIGKPIGQNILFINSLSINRLLAAQVEELSLYTPGMTLE